MPKVELGILLRVGRDGAPIIVDSIRDHGLVRQALRNALTEADAAHLTVRRRNAATTSGARSRARVLRALLDELGGDAADRVM